jgi:hypothetical protein
VVVSEAAFLAFKARGRLAPFALTGAALAACFAPWLLACAAAAGEGGGLAQNIGWVERPGPAQAAQVFALLQEPFYFRRSSAEPAASPVGALAGFVLITLPVVLLLVRARRRGGDEERNSGAGDDGRGDVRAEAEPRAGAIGFLLFFTLAPLVLAFAASRVLPFSVWGTRHLIVVAGPYLLLAGAALARLRPLWMRSAVLALLACWLVLAGAASALRREGVYVWCAWEGLAASLARDEGASAKTPARVYAFEDLVAYHLWFALGDEERFSVAVVRGLPGVEQDPAYFLPRRFRGVAEAAPSALEGERLWLAFRAAALDETRPPLSALRERGYRVERVYESAARGQRAFLVLATK